MADAAFSEGTHQLAVRTLPHRGPPRGALVVPVRACLRACWPGSAQAFLVTCELTFSAHALPHRLYPFSESLLKEDRPLLGPGGSAVHAAGGASAGAGSGVGVLRKGEVPPRLLSPSVHFKEMLERAQSRPLHRFIARFVVRRFLQGPSCVHKPRSRPRVRPAPERLPPRCASRQWRRLALRFPRIVLPRSPRSFSRAQWRRSRVGFVGGPSRREGSRRHLVPVWANHRRPAW